jgi:hypothetical protein
MTSIVETSLIAWGSVDFLGALINGRNCTTVALQPGEVEITLPEDFSVDDTEVMPTLTLLDPGVGRLHIYYVGGNDTQKVVRIRNDPAGQLTPANFWFKLERISP